MFNVGDIVELKSGGPLLTVADSSEPIFVQWFDADNKLQGTDFDSEMLRLIESTNLLEDQGNDIDESSSKDR